MLKSFALISLIGVATFWYLSRPITELPFDLPEGDANRGQYIAIASGCASCHGDDYAGASKYIATNFGNFISPNITPAYYNATAEQFALAILNGVRSDGKHLYPILPYTSYQNMTAQDVADLYAFISNLPEVGLQPVYKNELPFYVRWRRPLGIWKKLQREHPEVKTRGAYLVETLGHCQECHTPRTLWGTLDYSKAFAGGKVYDKNGQSKGVSPSLVSGDMMKWSVSEISSYLKDGFTPEYDSAGGAMVEVIANTSRLTEEDRNAIAEYIYNLSKP